MTTTKIIVKFVKQTKKKKKKQPALSQQHYKQEMKAAKCQRDQSLPGMSCN